MLFNLSQLPAYCRVQPLWNGIGAHNPVVGLHSTRVNQFANANLLFCWRFKQKLHWHCQFEGWNSSKSRVCWVSSSTVSVSRFCKLILLYWIIDFALSFNAYFVRDFLFWRAKCYASIKTFLRSKFCVYIYFAYHMNLKLNSWRILDHC